MPSPLIDELIDELIAAGSQNRAPVSETALAAFSSNGLVLPDMLLKLWRLADGVEFKPPWQDMKILPAREAREMFAAFRTTYPSTQLTMLPFFYDGQSNYCGVFLEPPLAGTAGYFLHDDVPRIVYQSIKSMLQALLACIADDGEVEDEVLRCDGDFAANAACSAQRQAIVRALLATDGERFEYDLVLPLLDEDSVEEFAFLLEADRNTRLDAIARMSTMQAPAIAQLLQRDAAAYAAFTSSLVEEIRTVGLQATVAEKGTVQVNGHWLDLETLYCERKNPESKRQLLARLCQQRQQAQGGRGLLYKVVNKLRGRGKIC